MSGPFLTDPIEGYLTVKAQEAMKLLTDGGMDKDLAFAVLEHLWTEDELYELEQKEMEEV